MVEQVEDFKKLINTCVTFSLHIDSVDKKAQCLFLLWKLGCFDVKNNSCLQKATRMHSYLLLLTLYTQQLDII